MRGRVGEREMGRQSDGATGRGSDAVMGGFN
jgi:hypothetical protein